MLHFSLPTLHFSDNQNDFCLKISNLPLFYVLLKKFSTAGLMHAIEQSSAHQLCISALKPRAGRVMHASDQDSSSVLLTVED